MKKMLLSLGTMQAVYGDGFNSSLSSSGQDNSFSQTLLLLGFGVLFFYFLLWRPEQKRRKAADKLRGSLKVGDRVIAMGIIGTIDHVREESIILKMCDESKIEILKAAVSEVYPAQEESIDLPSSDA
ncbi:MAG: preprotein translocase subunit YajC [Candidatus Rhabdochlamydia sp.]